MGTDIVQKIVIVTDTKELKQLFTSLDTLDKKTESTGNTASSSGNAFSKMFTGPLKPLGNFIGKMSGATTVMAGVGIVATAVFAAVVAGVSASINAAREFDQKFREVTTLFDTASVSTVKLKEDLIQLSTEGPLKLLDLTQGLYDLISAGIDAGDAIGVLDVAMKAAIGGVSDTHTAVDGLTSAMNAWQVDAADAEGVADSFFVAIRNGKTTFSELSASIGNLGPIAAATGVSLDTALAGVAAITTAGVKTNLAMTQMRSLLVAVARQVPQTQKVARELGVDFSVTALRAKGLQKFLMDVVEAAEGDEEMITKLVGRIEALNAIIQLTGSQAEKFNKNLQDMKDKAGSAQEAFDKMKDSTNNLYKTLKNQFSSVLVRIGNELLPYVEGALKSVIDRFDELSLTASEQVLKALKDVGAPKQVILDWQLTIAKENLAAMEADLLKQLGDSKQTIEVNPRITEAPTRVELLAGSTDTSEKKAIGTGPEQDLSQLGVVGLGFRLEKEKAKMVSAANTSGLSAADRLANVKFYQDQIDVIKKLIRIKTDLAANKKARDGLENKPVADEVKTAEQLAAAIENVLTIENKIDKARLDAAKASLETGAPQMTDKESYFLLKAIQDREKALNKLKREYKGVENMEETVANAVMLTSDATIAATNGAERYDEALKKHMANAMKAADAMTALADAAAIDAEPEILRKIKKESIEAEKELRELQGMLDSANITLKADAADDSHISDEEETRINASLEPLKAQIAREGILQDALEQSLQEGKTLQEILDAWLQSEGTIDVDFQGIKMGVSEAGDKAIEDQVKDIIDGVTNRLEEYKSEFLLEVDPVTGKSMADDGITNEEADRLVTQMIPVIDNARGGLVRFRDALDEAFGPKAADLVALLTQRINDMTESGVDPAKIKLYKFMGIWEGIANAADALEEITKGFGAVGEAINLTVGGVANFTDKLAGAKADWAEFQIAKAKAIDENGNATGADIGEQITAVASGVGAAMAAVSAVTGLIGFFQKRSAERKRQIEEMKKLRIEIQDNTRAIQESLGAFFKGGTTGGDADPVMIKIGSDVENAIVAALEGMNLPDYNSLSANPDQSINSIPNFNEGEPIRLIKASGTRAQQDQIRAQLHELDQLGIEGLAGLEDIFNDTFKATGSLNQSAEAALAALDEFFVDALKETGMVTRDFAGAMELLRRNTELMGIEGDKAFDATIQNLRENLKTTGSPNDALLQLEGFDLDTSEGQKAAIAFVESMTKKITEGDMDENFFLRSGMTANQWLELLGLTKDYATRDIGGEGDFTKNVSISRTITEIQGNEVIIILNEVSYWTKMMAQMMQMASGQAPADMMAAGRMADTSSYESSGSGVVVNMNFDIGLVVASNIDRVLQEADNKVRAEYYKAFPRY